jgi:acyl-CoA synthetase (AMP-forming)/AMP-acid ligase II
MKANPLTHSYYYSPGEIPPGVTLGEYFERTIQKFPQKAACSFRDKSHTWGELGKIVDRLTLALIDLGISRGDKIAVLFPNRLEFIYSALALAKIGAIIVPISERLRKREILHILGHAEVRAIIMVQEFWGFSFSDLLSNILTDLPNLKHVIVSGKAKYSHEISMDELIEKNLKVKYAPDYYHRVYLKEHPVEADDLLEIIFTSGTTGNPKGVMHTHNSRCRAAMGTIERMRVTSDDIWLVMVPLSHTTALVNSFYASVISGSCSGLLETWNVEEALKEIQRMRVTIPIGVPTMPIMMLQHPDFEKYTLSSLRSMLVGGAPLPVEVAKNIMRKFGCKLTSGYGMTETAASNLTSLDDPAEIVCRTVGTPQPGMEHKIVDEYRRIVPIGQEGEACARGQNVFVGYYKDPDRTAQVMDDRGWVYSGDLAKMDEFGNLIIVGRIKDMIVRGGENIAPTEIEEILYTFPKVKQAAVIGVPDERLGEASCACIIAAEGKSFSYEELKGYLKDKVARYKIPDHIVLMEEFPTTPSGKVRKVELREMVSKSIKSATKS